ncbi:MAG: hypothetical protein Q8K70_07995 [Bacteroidota bacterium]|nr:hypothetical protein [Bacteroidota bacterium]
MNYLNISIFALLLLFSSCGVITKARYGNGLKLNFESGFLSKEKSSKGQNHHRSMKIKGIKNPNNSIIDSVDDFSINTEIFSSDYIALIYESHHIKKEESINKNKVEFELNNLNELGKNKVNLKREKTAKKHDERPLAPYLITSLILMPFMPYISIFIVIKAKKIIIESDYAYKGYRLANIILFLSYFWLILMLLSSIVVFTLFRAYFL